MYVCPSENKKKEEKDTVAPRYMYIYIITNTYIQK
ncbi:unnamed protein product [Tenebrio molitor]|nr:unnamed protein product [Tenebrio molitor]